MARKRNELKMNRAKNHKEIEAKIMADAKMPNGYQRENQIGKSFLDKSVADGMLFRYRSRFTHYFTTEAAKNEFARTTTAAIREKKRMANSARRRKKTADAAKLRNPVAKKDVVKKSKPVKIWNLPVVEQARPSVPFVQPVKRAPAIEYPRGYKHTIYLSSYTLLDSSRDCSLAPVSRAPRCISQADEVLA